MTETPAEPVTPLVFVHIPKAAGTSLKDLIARVYAGKPSLFFVPGDGRVERFAALPAASRAACVVVAGHEPFGLQRVFDGTGTTPAVITVLRDPVARVVSLYRYIFREPNHARHAEFVADRPTVRDVLGARSFAPFDNDQTRFLAGPEARALPFGDLGEPERERAVRNLEEGVTVFGLQERMDLSVRHFASRLGWSATTLPELNRGDSAGVGSGGPGAGAGQVDIPEVTEADRSAILETNAMDAALYARAVAIFDGRVGEASEGRGGA